MSEFNGGTPLEWRARVTELEAKIRDLTGKWQREVDAREAVEAPWRLANAWDEGWQARDEGCPGGYLLPAEPGQNPYRAQRSGSEDRPAEGSDRG